MKIMTMNMVLPEEAVINDTAKALTAFIVDLLVALFIDSGNPALILVRFPPHTHTGGYP